MRTEPLSVLTLNAAHGRGTAFHQLTTPNAKIRENLGAIAQLIRESAPDVVALQELDDASDWSGRFSHLDFIADAAGYPHRCHGLHVDLPKPRIRYGTGILSRHPLSDCGGQPFAMNWADTKGFCCAKVHAPRGAFWMVSVHLDFKRTRERRAQLAILSDFLAERPGPLIVAGDFNCALADSDPSLVEFARRHELTTTGESLPTFPSARPSGRFDEILVSPELAPMNKRAIDSRVSDHLPVMLELEGAG